MLTVESMVATIYWRAIEEIHMNKFRILLSQVVKKSHRYHFQTRNFYENLIDGAIDSGGVVVLRIL